jgi:hypothetical protein
MDPNDKPCWCEVDEGLLKRAIAGWSRYLFALRKAPFRSKSPRLQENVASAEIKRIEPMARYWRRQYETWGEGFDEDVVMLHPSALRELPAAAALDMLAEQRSVERSIAETEKLIQTQKLIAQEEDPGALEQHCQSLTEQRSRVKNLTEEVEGLDKTCQAAWKLKPDQILDIGNGAESEDLTKDIL